MVNFVSQLVWQILEDCCMAFANMQLSELWPMGLLLQTFFYMHVTRMRKMRTEHCTYETYCFVFIKIRRGIATNTNCIIRNDNI